jgi:hypothetical protein
MAEEMSVLARGRRRGVRALCAGVLLTVLACGIWLWLGRLFADNSGALSDPSTMRKLGRLNVAFALLAIAGLIGIANGWVQARTGRGKKALIWALVIVAISAFFTFLEA